MEDLESEFESPQVVTPDTRDKKSNSSSTPKSTRKPTPTLFSGSSACSSSNTSLSKFLDHTVLTTPTDEPARSHLPRAKLLTSISFLAMLEEKEKKKQQALEEKEKNKREREEKKKKRQEELEKRAKVREEKKKQREEEKKRKAEEKEQRIKEKGKGKMLPKSVKITPSMSTARTGAKRKSNTSSEARRPLKRSRGTEPSMSEEINPNMCCMCFSTYEDDIL